MDRHFFVEMSVSDLDGTPQVHAHIQSDDEPGGFWPEVYADPYSPLSASTFAAFVLTVPVPAEEAAK